MPPLPHPTFQNLLVQKRGHTIQGVLYLQVEAVRDFYRDHQIRIGVKPAGGIRTTKDAIKQLVLVKETAGDEWLTNKLFRIGASALLNDLLMQRRKLATGYYSGPNYVTID